MMKKWLCILGLSAAVVWTAGMSGENVSAASAPTGEKTVVYRDAEGITEIPQTVEGENGEGPYYLAERERLRERWEDDFAFTVVFEEYGSDFYMLEGVKLAAGRKEPFNEDRGGLLLSAIGVSPEDYAVEQVVWNGESYRNEDGVLCRNALATGKKRVWDERVIYRSGKEENGEKPAGRNVPEQGNRGSRETKQESSGAGLWFRAAALILSLGLLLLFAAAVLYWYREKKKKAEQENEGC
ncbi:MAG TPA: hypothetical protein IAA17_06675 [Candidatus Lachnoclostridium stercorigallinarum]|mgnify:CR=1 FL=1|uniref:Uncharacterized protein n=1 Tax=Candidatus Lachnoclostridium stercorigallinarum TaxID=2838634 RepID=A0A9D2GIF2_9FIRM|nr:hypothetical protein [Candidatus Lachnoclostridium stercorigallinarum]